MFQLKTSEITESLKSQIATLNVSKNKRGITDRRMHHEIYLSDARRVAPEKLKTVIRHPIKRT